MSSIPASSEPFVPGHHIPGTRCTFERVLGEGGYGTVLLCRHIVLNRRVVLKVLLMSHRERDDLVDRMLAEAQALAQLDHPNIALIHDAGMTEEDTPRPFLTLQYYPGETLAQSLAAMPPGSGIGLLPALDLGIELCDGLRAAHERGIVHRDVKPANVYLARTGEGRTVTKVIDFGIAHFKEATTRATGKMYLGTPRYSAPEQIQGLSPSARTDLYAVGLVLYDCLCGRGPFDPREGHLDANAMMRAHLQEEPAPLSAYGKDLPEELDALVAALVAKRPEDRPPTAALVAARLREIRARLQATASPVQAADDANRTDPTPFDNRLIRYSAETDGTSPALPERGRDLEERAQATPPADSAPAVGPAGTVRLTPDAGDGTPAALPAATSEPLDRSVVTPSMAPEPAARSTHGTEDFGVGPPDVVRVDPADDAGEPPRMLSNAPVVTSQAPPPPRASHMRARMAAALGGAMTAVALSAGIWHLRQTPGSGATSRLVGSPVGSAVMAASFAGGSAARPSATPVPAPSSGSSPSAARMLAAPADETTSPSASNAKTAPSPSASSSGRLPARSRAGEKQKGDPLSELKRTFSAPPGPLERPGVTF